MDYQRSKKLLIDDLKKLTDPKIKMSWGKLVYTPAELAEEIKNETEIGKKYIKYHSQTAAKINEVRKNNPPKKHPKWKFWK